MSSEEETEGLEDAAPAVETPAAEAPPVEIKPVEDGDAFINEMQATGLPPLHKVVVNGREFNIDTPTGHDVPEIFRGKLRKSLDKPEQMEFDALETAERIMVITLHKCVVKSNRQPLWTEANLVHMMRGPKAKVFTRIIQELYNACLDVNDFLDPRNQPNAAGMLARWL